MDQAVVQDRQVVQVQAERRVLAVLEDLQELVVVQALQEVRDLLVLVVQLDVDIQIKLWDMRLVEL